MSFREIFKKIKKNKNFMYGVPFLILMVAGSFGLQKFSELRYKYSRQQTITPEEMELIGVNMKKPEDVTIEREFEKITKLDIENWENIRGPRPWEENVD
ncbi:cytochrome c oxidase assembly protein COX16 homolog, mitochondrial [Glossina fuscipes]|uniref:Cytochrome c oxidase assembly protein COX16 homolog, mitochondrial n=2 Tax=Nemorhina TaxID=44051 RepID=A0A9C5Z7I6_9MUSC|nr:cytochrome c oxidase assembly protein COX16 homolog, mitochondrial [Glossina fuscipes]